jgi:hypothetical protein
MPAILRFLDDVIHKVASVPDFRKHQVRCFILLIAAFGFGVQVTQVSIHYFSYGTHVQVHVLFPEKAVHHNVAVCVSYADLVNWTALSNASEKDGENEKPKLTVRQLFELTPDVNNTIEACYFRVSNWRAKFLQGDECYNYFHVHKYMAQSYICYKFELLIEVTLDMSSITRSLSASFAMSTLSLTKAFNKSTNVNMITFHGSYPYLSRDVSVVTYILDSTLTKNKLHNYFDLFSNDYEFVRLEAPYDTGCIDRKVEDIFTCKYSCFVQHYSAMGKIAPLDPVTDPLDLLIIDGEDLEDDEILANVSKIDKICVKKCDFVPCHSGYTKTTFLPRLIKELNLGYYSRTPIEPSIISESIPGNSFVEYFSFTAGCFGIWFGISFMSLDPFKKQKCESCKDSGHPFNVFIVNPSKKVARILRQ